MFRWKRYIPGLPAIDNDSRVFRLKVKQQPGDRDLCVVDRLRLFPVLVLFPQLFSNFTAIAVDTEADVIKKQAGFSLYIYTRETLKIRIEAYGRIRKWFLIDISRKIVAGSRRIVVELVLNLYSVNIIDKTV